MDLFAEMWGDAAVEDQSIQLGRVGEDAIDDQSVPAFVVYTLTGIWKINTSPWTSQNHNNNNNNSNNNDNNNMNEILGQNSDVYVDVNVGLYVGVNVDADVDVNVYCSANNQVAIESEQADR